MAVQLHKSLDSETLGLSVDGRFDFASAPAFWDACDHEITDHRGCVIDLDHVDGWCDSGLALLLMFCRRAQRAGVPVRITGCKPEVAARLRALEPSMPGLLAAQ